MRKLLPAALGAALILAGPALADARGTGQGAGRAMMPEFGAFEQDANGGVTLESFQNQLAAGRGVVGDALVARLMQEADAEGKLDEAALRAGIAAYMEEQRAERRDAAQARLFARIDANSDGVISAEEYEAFAGRVSERMERKGERGRRWR